MPPWAPDESIYHLSLVAHELFYGAFWAPLGHGNGGFFALGDHVAQLALWMHSWPAARGVQIWSVVFLGEALLALFPGLRVSQALLAQTLFVLCPVTLWQLGCAYVDIMQGAFVLGALGLWAKVHPQGASTRGQPWPLQGVFLCAWLVGCAIGCKVLALVWLPLFVVWLFAYVRPRPLAACAIITCLVAPFSADIVHNLWRYHAPLFPFGAPLWPGGEALWPSQREALGAFMALHGPRLDGVALHGLARALALPFALMFAADFASPRFDGVVGLLPGIAMLAAGFAFYGRRRFRPLAHGCAPRRSPPRATSARPLLAAALAAAVGMPTAAWLCTSLQARFLVGPLWALAWLTALWLGQGLSRLSKFRRLGAQALWAACVVAVCAQGVARVRPHLPPWSLSLVNKDPQQRRQARLQAVPASALCDLVPQGAAVKVMLVWCQRLSLFCLSDQVSDSYDEAASLKQALQAPQAAQVLWDAGITHMLVHEGRTHEDLSAQLWRKYVVLRASNLQALHTLGPYTLFRLVPPRSLRHVNSVQQH